MFYFDLEDNKTIVRVFPLEDYKKIDPNMEMEEYSFGVLYTYKDSENLLEDDEAVFKNIPNECDGIIYYGEAPNYVDVKPTTKEEVMEEISFT